MVDNRIILTSDIVRMFADHLPDHDRVGKVIAVTRLHALVWLDNEDTTQAFLLRDLRRECEGAF